jgi:hypothetical protein
MRRSTRRTFAEPFTWIGRPTPSASIVADGFPSSVSFLSIVILPHVPLTRSVEPAGAALIRFWRFWLAQLTLIVAAPTGAAKTSAAERAAMTRPGRIRTMLAGSRSFS